MVLTGRRAGIFRRDDVAALGRRYLAECLAVARAEGANLGDEVIDEIVGMLAQAPPDITTSMLTDREANRPLEWDIRNGVILRKAAGPRARHPDQRGGGAVARRRKRRPRLDTVLYCVWPCTNASASAWTSSPAHRSASSAPSI